MTIRSKKQLEFVNQYFLCGFNATEAYQRAYGTEDYNSAAASASRLLKDVKVKQEIEARFEARAMSANEVIDRLSQIARADFGDCMDDDGQIDIKKVKQARKTHLIKKIKQRRFTTPTADADAPTLGQDLEVEFYSSHEALRDMAKIHSLFTEKNRVEDWRTDLIDLLKKGEISAELVLQQLDRATAQDILRAAGLPFEEGAT